MAPQTLTITYISAYTNGIASAQATLTYTLPTPSAGSPIEPTLALRNIVSAGGLWFTNSSGAQQFIPEKNIIGVTAP